MIYQILLRSASTITSSTLSVVNPSAGVILSSNTALLASIDNLIANETVSKLTIRQTKTRDWITVISLLYEKALKEPMIDKKKDQKEASEVERI